MSDDLMGMIETLICRNAEVRIGPRRVKIVDKGANGLAEIACPRSDWDAYINSGRRLPAPERMKDRLR